MNIEHSKNDFFVPGVWWDVEGFYKDVRERLTVSHNIPLSDKRIYSVEYTIDGKSIVQNVGEKSPTYHEPVWVIFQCADTFYVCTEHGGINAGSKPQIISDVQKVVYFSDPSSHNT